MYTNTIIRPYDFSEVVKLSEGMIFCRCIEKAKELVVDYQQLCDHPCIGIGGGTKDEIEALNREVKGLLPHDYIRFLAICRYMQFGPGYEVGGLPHDNVSVAEHPWLSHDHIVGVDHIVFANYWRYSDGDKLLIDVSHNKGMVIAYLHEHGPLYEIFAPSFTLALWRLLFE